MRIVLPPFHTAALAALLLLAAAPDAVTSRAAPDLTEPTAAWERGDYPAALRGYLAILDSSDASLALEFIALHTGELFHTLELTDDGDVPGFSPDGRFISYEAGRGGDRHVRVAASATPTSPLATLPGRAAAFSPEGTRIAYVGMPAPPEPAISSPAGSGSASRPAADTGLILIRDLGTGDERVLAPAPRGTARLLLGRGDTVLAAGLDASGTTQIYRIDGRGPAVALTAGASPRVLQEIDPGGATAVFTERTTGVDARFGIIRVSDGEVRMVAGSAPTLSADGRTIAYVTRRDGAYQLVVADVTTPGASAVVRAGKEPIASPALSHDGGSIAFQLMTREDWELYVIRRGGNGERRITREIQHDVSPRFLDAGRLLGLVGESRHRRSYLYDLTSGRRMRLFHNNTIRTIAPEYRWAPSPDGTKLLIVAERDGDTVSPERGVYLMDLTRTVTLDDLRRRLRASLAAEEALRAEARRLFAPIRDRVREAVADVSLPRVFRYQQDLFQVDSKHISQPGNKRAAEYLFETYRSFGYEPRYQTFQHRTAFEGQTSNVLAALPGTVTPELVYVVSSHYDSVRESPGADDNSSGTAALLEVARILARRPQPATILFASFTGEESGLLGSREFTRRAAADRMRVAGALNNDMLGWANDHRLDNTIRYSNPAIRDLQHGAALEFTRLITYDARYYRNTDAHALYDAFGDVIGGIGSYPILGNPHYHQPHDVLETINHELVTEVARTTAASVMLMASAPSPVKGLRMDRDRDGRAELSWSPAPERDVTGYIVRWMIPGTDRPQEQRVTSPRITLRVPPGSTIAVAAVNGQGLEGWEPARTAVR